MYVIRLFRIAHWCWCRGTPVIPGLLKALNRIVFGVVLPPSIRIGRNVLLNYEELGPVIHRNAEIGNDVTIGSGVMIGGRLGSQVVPLIGDGAMIDIGAKALGPVIVGRYASIGANAAVLDDVPDFAVAVGVPAKVVKMNRPEDLPDYRAFTR